MHAYDAKFDDLVKRIVFVMLVPGQVRDDVSGIPKMLELLDSGFRRNDKIWTNSTHYEFIKFTLDEIKRQSLRDGSAF